MAVRGIPEPKRQRQYEHIKKSLLARGKPEKVAKRIAGATVQKIRREKGEAAPRPAGNR
jgi:hypothetical protein